MKKLSAMGTVSIWWGLSSLIQLVHHFFLRNAYEELTIFSLKKIFFLFRDFSPGTDRAPSELRSLPNLSTTSNYGCSAEVECLQHSHDMSQNDGFRIWPIWIGTWIPGQVHIWLLYCWYYTTYSPLQMEERNILGWFGYDLILAKPHSQKTPATIFSWKNWLFTLPLDVYSYLLFFPT